MNSSHEGGGPPRALILALDGATLDLIDPWIEQGKLPHLGSLITWGAHGRLRSTTPPITPCAWTSFSTACNPGRHGIFDFQQIVPGTYSLAPTNGSLRRVRTLWEYLTDLGLSVGLYNLPWMYPPPPLDGYCVCGFDAPDINPQAVHPPELANELRESIPDISLAAEFLKKSGGQYDLEALRRQVRVNVEAAKLLLTRHPVDVCVLTIMLLDQAAHFFLHPDASMRGWGESADALLTVHQWVDEGIGELLELVPDDAVIMGVSDHGVAPTTLKINIDRALADAGLLVFRPDAGGIEALARRPQRKGSGLRRLASRIIPQGLWLRLRQARGKARSRALFGAVDWTRTKAFAWGNFAQVRLNLQGREPEGIVPPEERDAVVQQVKDVLRGLKHPDTDEALFADALTPEELYHGPHTEGAADVLGIEAADGIDASIHLPVPDAPFVLDHAATSLVNPELGEKVAGHSMDGIFFASGPPFREGATVEGAGICDALPTLLHALDVKLPNDLDGAPIEGAFDADYWEAHPPRLSDRSLGEQDARDAGYSDGDQEQVEQRLRDLGYM